MGTRFMCTLEAPIHHGIKRTMVDAKETDTAILLRRWKNSVRLFNNEVAKEAAKIEKTSADGKFEEVAPYVSGKRGRQVYSNGDRDFGVWSVGQAIGSIQDVPTCAELLERIESEGMDTIGRLRSLMI
ncbi:2-nitropropane dioxygenase NPD [Macrophomina phaseolina MS6]|uniref:2-nitropropane dioxygenase NPD n=1 Tax=Macrophomina phaseolina (strain MS6) TaxID=1126212 RepID=K2SBG8_MACPH|nr:2-nitropropane dioxygenase NPD [Macrophomina phaseolina MS6]